MAVPSGTDNLDLTTRLAGSYRFRFPRVGTFLLPVLDLYDESWNKGSSPGHCCHSTRWGTIARNKKVVYTVKHWCNHSIVDRPRLVIRVAQMGGGGFRAPGWWSFLQNRAPILNSTFWMMAPVLLGGFPVRLKETLNFAPPHPPSKSSQSSPPEKLIFMFGAKPDGSLRLTGSYDAYQYRFVLASRLRKDRR